MRSWLILALVATVGVTGCGGGSDHARAAAPTTAMAASVAPSGDCVRRLPADLAAPGPYRVRSVHIRLAGPLRPGPADLTKVPVLAMAGGADTLVPARLERTYYDQLPASVPHAYAEIAGATHSAYERHCTAERTCGIVDSYATSFFLTYLYGLRNPLPHLARVHLRTADMP